MFIAHDLATWLGIPAGIVIAALIILRKRGFAVHERGRLTITCVSKRDGRTIAWHAGTCRRAGRSGC